MDDSAEPDEADVDAVIEEAGGDLREAVRMLLYDIAVLAAGITATVSRGYVRGRRPQGHLRVVTQEEPGPD